MVTSSKKVGSAQAPRVKGLREDLLYLSHADGAGHLALAGCGSLLESRYGLALLIAQGVI